MTSVAELREQLDMHKELLAATNEFLQHDPTDADTLQSKADTENDIARLEREISDLSEKPTVASSKPPLPAQSPSGSTARYPPLPPPPPSQHFSVGDKIQAKYSADGIFYAAVVLSKTGNPNDPLYTVKFTEYDTTETRKAHQLKAADQNKKRKAEDTGKADSRAPPPPPPPSSFGNGSITTTAAPAIDKSATKKHVPSMVADGPTRLPREPKKLKSNKALDKAKSNWQAFQKTGPKVSGSISAPKQKESQFRVGNQPGARVGFTGSGKGMQKDTTRPQWKAPGQDD